MKSVNKFPKRLVFIITDLLTGGAEIMLYKLLSSLNRERFEPIVISLMDRGRFGDLIEALNIPVYTVGMKPGIPTLKAAYRLLQIVRQLEPDLIQGWMYHGNVAAQLSSILSIQRIPVLWDIQNSISSLSYEKRMTVAVIRLSAYISKLARKIIFVSKVSQRQHEALGFDIQEACVIPNGIDTGMFIPSCESGLSVRAELGLPEEAILIGLIARFHPQKDHKSFLEAAALLPKNSSNVHFLLAGQGVEINNQGLHQLIQELGLINQISLLGERTDIPRLTSALDINCLSSAYGEGFPLAVGEAMSCGVPCVVTDVGDSAWLVGDTGRVVPPRDPEGLCTAWLELIEMGTPARRELGARARQRIKDNFSLESVVQKYLEIYEEVIYG